MGEQGEETGQKLTERSTKEAYFESLAEWAKQATLAQNAMLMFPYYLMANYPTMFPGLPSSAALQAAAMGQPQALVQGSAAAPGEPAAEPRLPAPNFSGLRILGEAAQLDIIQRLGGYEYVLSPFWKRAVAETIDMFILFIVKIIITFGVVNLFNIEFDEDVIRRTLDQEDLFSNFFDTSLDFISMSTDLLLIEMLTKFIVCCYEALWTYLYQGATPGKSLMKIRIYYVEAVMPLQGPSAKRGARGIGSSSSCLPAPREPCNLRKIVRKILKRLRILCGSTWDAHIKIALHSRSTRMNCW